MRMVTKFLALLLVLSMLCSVMPVGMIASAEELPVVEEAAETVGFEEPSTETAGVQIPTITEEGEIAPQVNPLYDGVVDPDDITPHHRTENPDAAVQATFVTVSSAATQVRNYMKQRTETFTIYVKDSSSSYQTVINNVLTEATKHTGVSKEGDSLLWQWAGWTGYYSYTYSNSTYYYTFDLTFTYYTTAKQESELDTAVKNLLNQLNVKYKSDYEKIRTVYDYICANVTYDYDHLADDTYYLQYTPYAALVNKTAVCQGYALLFYRLMLELGVDCRVITGFGGDEENYGAHAWNIVELNGLWYNVDATWDAGYDEYIWFLCSTADFPYHYRYLDYETVAWHYAYPMASESYTEGTKGEAEKYFVGGYCGSDAIWLIDRFGCVTISGSGEMSNYPFSASKEYLAPWRYWEDEITSVVVEDGITKIGDYTFCSEDNLTSVTLPDTLEIIGRGAFTHCSNLKQITIPDSVTTIVDTAFRESGLTSIVIPDSVTDYDLDFHYCYNLETVVLGTGITEIRIQAFYDCYNLTSITFRGEITSIGEAAFSSCYSLKNFTIPDTVTTIARSAFEGCTGLTSITIPDTVTTIATCAFEGCTGLTSITIPDSVTSVGSFAFDGCTNLREVTFEGGPSLGGYLFLGTYGSVKTIRFLGEAPTFSSESLYDVTATAYYPAGVTGWTADVLQDYGGEITWVASAHTHKYEATITEPTCTEGGFTTYQCTLCVDSYVRDYVDALGHSYESVVTDPTCTEGGFTTHTCSVCGDSYVDAEVKATGHSYESVVTAPTCTEGGYTTHTCSVCGDSYVDAEVEATGHSYESVVTDPTCTEGGYTTYTCTACGDSYVTDETESLGHNYETTVVDPTCEEPGGNVHTCSRCGDSYVTDETEALGHSYESAETEATCTKPGGILHTCTVCGHSYLDVETEALGHNYEDGYCTVCGRPDVIFGDINGDGEIDLLDANLIVSYYNGTIDLTEEQLLAADLNGDGEIDLLDANLIVSYYNGTIDFFPVEE